MNLTELHRVEGRKCQNHSEPELWYPEDLEGPKAEAKAEAKALCRECPAQLACLRYAIEAKERFGIWGGFDPSERKQLSTRLDEEYSRILSA